MTAPPNELKKWLLKTYTKINFSTRGSSLGLKKNRVDTFLDFIQRWQKEQLGEEQFWIKSVYNQGWYWPLNKDGGLPSNVLVPFYKDGSFVGDFTPWDGTIPDLPTQNNIKFELDEVVNEKHAYYRFTYRFNNENLTLYYKISHGTLDSTGEPSVFWAKFENDSTPPTEGAPPNELKKWLLKTYAKGNFGTRGFTFGLKKNRVDTFLDFIQMVQKKIILLLQNVFLIVLKAST